MKMERPRALSKSRRTGLPLPKPYLLKMMTDDDEVNDIAMSQQRYLVLAVGLYPVEVYKMPHGTHCNIKYAQYVEIY